MSRIFGRESTHSLEDLARLASEMLADDEESNRAIGWNLIHDDRVSEARAEHFFEVTNRPGSIDELKQALVDYVEEWVSRQPFETYLSHRNAKNFVRFSRPPSFDLGHVLNVSRLVHQITTEPIDSSWNLDESLLKGAEDILSTAATVGAAAPLVNELLRAEWRLRGNRPTWAGSWDLLEKSIDAAVPSSWNAAVGLWRRRNAYQIAIRYPVSAVGQLVRPTQLDIGFFQYHFPSPGKLTPEKGGFAMDLRLIPRPFPDLVSEFIHVPIRFDHQHWLATGLRGRVDGLGDVSPWKFRGQDARRLLGSYAKPVRHWKK